MKITLMEAVMANLAADNLIGYLTEQREFGRIGLLK